MRSRAKSRSLGTVLLATLLAACGLGEEQAIRQAFEEYKQSILDQDGERAASLVTQNTLDYYDEMRDLAVEAGPEQILDRRLTDRLAVATYRLTLDLESLRQMTPRALFAFAVDEGLIGSRSDVAGLELGTITLSGDTATANAVSDGQEAPLEWEFRREGDQWRLDLEALLAVVNLVLQNLARESGVSENQLIYQTLEARTGQRVTGEVWARP